MSVAFYPSAHGFGHFVRTSEVMKAMPREVPLVLRTAVPDWFIRQELTGVDYRSLPAALDCGVLGRDSTHVDPARTFARAEEIERANEARLREEIELLRREEVRVVATDVPSFPLLAASEAGLRSLVISNFTWTEIYEALAEQARAAGEAATARRGEELTRSLRDQYARGDFLLIPGMALEMTACARKIPVPVIARRGRAERERLCRRLGLDPVRPIYLLYLGQEGYEGIDWRRLARLDGAQFVSFRAVGQSDGRVHALGEGILDHADATATADAVLGKLGYSLCAECVATGTPLIFPPRPGFIEAEALGRAMVGYGLGVPVSSEDFRALDWSEALERCRELAARAPRVACNGAEVCAELITRLWRGEDIPL